MTAIVLYAGLLPTQLTGFGIEVNQIKIPTLAGILLVLLVYFLGAFAFYAWTDVVSYVRDLGPLVEHLAQKTIDRTEHVCHPGSTAQTGVTETTTPTSEQVAASHAELRDVVLKDVKHSMNPYLYRLWFEIGVPVVVTLANISFGLWKGYVTGFTYK